MQNWHWAEKNLTAWSEQRLRELLVGVAGLEEATGKGYCKITELEKMEGDVTIQFRKQKKFPLYELEITLKWKGELWDADGKVVTEAGGMVKIPDLSEETYDDLEMTTVLDDETKAKLPLKEAMRTTGCKNIRLACMSFVKELKASIASGEGQALAGKSAAIVKDATAKSALNTYVTSKAESSKVADIKFKYSFSPPVPVIYETLLDTDRIRGATASDAKMSKEVGGKLMMFSGAVEGENVTLTPFNGTSATIVWKWRFATWQPNHYSTVTIELTDKDGGCQLELKQTGVPEEEKERTEQGWKGLLFERMKAMLGGSVLS
jgi:activator of HSP90 ATPase